MSWVKTYLLPQGERNSLTPYGNNNLNFRLARDQVVFLEFVSQPASSNRFLRSFFSILELGSITKHLMTGPGQVIHQVRGRITSLWFTEQTNSCAPTFFVVPFGIEHVRCILSLSMFLEPLTY